MPLDAAYPDIAFSVCPHDCPSACALDVERLAPERIGAVFHDTAVWIEPAGDGPERRGGAA